MLLHYITASALSASPAAGKQLSILNVDVMAYTVCRDGLYDVRDHIIQNIFE